MALDRLRLRRVRSVESSELAVEIVDWGEGGVLVWRWLGDIVTLLSDGVFVDGVCGVMRVLLPRLDANATLAAERAGGFIMAMVLDRWRSILGRGCDSGVDNDCECILPFFATDTIGEERILLFSNDVEDLLKATFKIDDSDDGIDELSNMKLDDCSGLSSKSRLSANKSFFMCLYFSIASNVDA